jgi:hypothetical protein
MSLDKKLAADKVRAILEKRIARTLDCKPQELPRMKLGTLIHFVFLLDGTSEELGGFNTTMSAAIQLVGHEILWKEESEEKTQDKDEVIN